MSVGCACPPDRAWGILRGRRLHRVTFSRSLAEYIIRRLGSGYTLARVTFQLGRPLEAGTTSPSGLYAVVTPRGRVLRVSLIQGAAEEFRHETRTIWSCSIVLLQPVSEGDHHGHLEEPRSPSAAVEGAA